MIFGIKNKEKLVVNLDLKTYLALKCGISEKDRYKLGDIFDRLINVYGYSSTFQKRDIFSITGNNYIYIVIFGSSILKLYSDTSPKNVVNYFGAIEFYDVNDYNIIFKKTI